MKKILDIVLILFLFTIVACESAEDISRKLDHAVPGCNSLTLKAGGETKTIDDSIVGKLLWGVVPKTNLEVISLPTVTAKTGTSIEISIEISDNDALKTVELSYPDWLYSKYINFANPDGEIPLTPRSYTFTAQVNVPATAKTLPWIETYYFNDGSSMKITQSYHKITLTVVDVNMNARTIPIFVKVE
jgi:hypothetical protein